MLLKNQYEKATVVLVNANGDNTQTTQLTSAALLINYRRQDKLKQQHQLYLYLYIYTSIYM